MVREYLSLKRFSLPRIVEFADYKKIADSLEVSLSHIVTIGGAMER